MNRSAAYQQKYETADVLAYIDTIGEHHPKFKSRTQTETSRIAHKIKMLQGCLAGCEARVTWGELNERIIIAHVQSELEKYQSMRG